MSGIAGSAAVAVLVASVAMVCLCVVGLIRASDAFDRLHFPGAAALVGAPGVAMALSISRGPSGIGSRAWLITVLLVFTSGILTHATARAEWLRRRGDDVEMDEEEG